VVVLDEATANVDPVTEQLLQQALQRVFAQTTCVVIAHRLSTVRDADRIYVLKDGSAIAAGTHDELLQSSPDYAELARLSFS